MRKLKMTTKFERWKVTKGVGADLAELKKVNVSPFSL